MTRTDQARPAAPANLVAPSMFGPPGPTAPAAVRSGPAAGPGRARQTWTALPWWARILVVFAASRVVTTLLFVWVGSQATTQSRAGAHPSLIGLSTTWDGQWYWWIAVNGYPTVLPHSPDGSVATNAWAFLPVYPTLVKLLTFGVLPWPTVAFVVSLLAGFGAAVLLGALLRPHIGDGRAVFAAAVFACSPLSFELQTAYAEALGLVFLFAALTLIDRRRYLWAILPALLLAFTRPGVLALALTAGVQLLLRYIQGRRGGRGLPPADLAGGVLLTVVCVLAGFAWSGIAALVTGVPDAYFATESAWRALWMPTSSLVFFEPWHFAAVFWSTQVVGAQAAVWVGPVVLALLVVAFAAALFLPQVRRLGSTVRLWAAAWGLWLLAVFFPQSSVFRLLMPMAPLAGAITPRSTPARAAVLLVSLGLQALWLWVTYGPIQEYWTVP